MQQVEQNKLKQRVIYAAAAALADHQYVSPADVLVGIGLLPPRLLKEWRNGQVEFLAKAVQGSPQKIGASLTALRGPSAPIM